MDVTLPSPPFLEQMEGFYKTLQNHYNTDFFSKKITTGLEHIDEQAFREAFREVLYAQEIFDIPFFLLRQIISTELTFKKCKSCEKYFPATGHGNAEYCHRMYKDTGKTCKEIGAIVVYQEKVSKEPAIKAYNKAYKSHFARIKYKKMSKEAFQAWSEMARRMRDEVIAGKMHLEEYKEWLRR